MLNIELQGQVLLIQGELNRHTVPTVQPCKALLGVQGRVEFRLGQLQQVDTAGLAWLIHQLAIAKQQQLQIHLTQVPEQLKQIASVGGVLNLLPIES